MPRTVIPHHAGTIAGAHHAGAIACPYIIPGPYPPLVPIWALAGREIVKVANAIALASPTAKKVRFDMLISLFVTSANSGKPASTRNFLFLLQKFVAIDFSARIALFENIETR